MELAMDARQGITKVAKEYMTKRAWLARNGSYSCILMSIVGWRGSCSHSPIQPLLSAPARSMMRAALNIQVLPERGMPVKIMADRRAAYRKL